MSRSYRRPYTAICGNESAKRDKVMAHRGVRRAHKAYLKFNWAEEDDFLMPHKRECHWNNVYSWVRDGKQFLPRELRKPGSQPNWWGWYNQCSRYTQADIDKRLADDAEYLRRLYRK